MIPLLNYLGGPSTIIFAGCLYAAASVLWCILAGNRVVAWAGSIVAALLLFLAIYNVGHPTLDVKYARGGVISNESFVRWNSFSRVALRQHGPDSFSIDIDADANTYIAKYNFDALSKTSQTQLLNTGRGAAYLLRPGAKTLVIGSGGGLDVSRALASGSRDVTGV